MLFKNNNYVKLNISCGKELLFQYQNAWLMKLQILENFIDFEYALSFMNQIETLINLVIYLFHYLLFYLVNKIFLIFIKINSHQF